MANPNTLFVPTYNRSDAPMVKGKGTYLWDSKGKKYLDFGSGIAVTALGHSNPLIVSALKKQGSMLLHASNLYHMEPQIQLAKLLVKKSFGDRIFFCNSGTEANEGAIKFARKVAQKKDKKKYNILSFTDSFHGRTYGGLSATAQPLFHKGFLPMVPGFKYAPFNDIEATKKVLSKHLYSAIIVEPLQGESGINSASTEFLKFLREYSLKNDITLIFDEIQCGVGRTGTLWNYEQHDVIPDIMTLAKPLGAGLPLGAIVCTEDISKEISPGDHGTTFGGNPLACSLGNVVLSEVSKKSFLRNVNKNGEYLKNKLENLASNTSSIKEIRGTGLMIGAEMTVESGSIIEKCKKSGLLLIKAGHNTIRFMPPLTVTTAEIDKAVSIFNKILISETK